MKNIPSWVSHYANQLKLTIQLYLSYLYQTVEVSPLTGYLFGKYFFFTAAVTVALMTLVWLSGWGELSSSIPFCIFWGSLTAAWITDHWFKRRNFWILYHNLKLSKFLLLSVGFGCIQTLNVIVSFFLIP